MLDTVQPAWKDVLPLRRTRCCSRADLFAALARAERRERPAGHRLLLLADVDDFRGYNARHGYASGDRVLARLDERLSSVAPAYRVGPDAFAALLHGSALDLARRLAQVLAALTIEEPEPLQCSLGAVLLPVEADGVAAFALAEERLEDQKRRGLLPADRIGEVLLAVMGAHDEALRVHALEVARLSEAVAGRLGLGVSDRALVRRTAELHDLGKLAIDPALLAKPAPLEASEWAEIRRHTVVGDELLRLFPPLAGVASLVRATHERPDGGGYPDGARAEEIPLAARIVSACDAYHAMVSDRPYAAIRSVDEARTELEAAAGSQFDPAVVAALATEVSDRHLPAVDAAASFEDGSLRQLARLHALLESASVVEDPGDLPRALEAVAQVIGESLGYGGVVINLYRREWDDFVVSTVHGDDPALRRLLGSTYDWSIWRRLLQPQFHRSGAYVIYAGEYDWRDQSGHRVVPHVGADAHPDAWQSEDEIFVPFHHSDGHILGIFNVALPRSGRRPSEEELRLLSVVVRHAARAVQRAQETAAAAAHRRALEHLLRVSSKLTQTAAGTSVLEAVSAGISEALGFERVAVYLRAGSDELRLAAAAGDPPDDPRLRLPFGFDELRLLLDPRYETAGCYLLPLEAAQSLIPAIAGVHGSSRNGRGTWAWRRHWLVVPLHGRDGSCLGVVLADDPLDRLLPTPERLQALRLFANQATVALESVAQYERQRYLAEHDALTGLGNRHSFMKELEATLGGLRRSSDQVALAYCDLDGFKELNDAHGHAIGDAALVEFARSLAGSIRVGDSAFRIGGDEFALVLRACDEREAERVVERALAAWARAKSSGAVRARLGASFGIALWRPEEPATVEELLRRADEAMYDAKRTQSRLKIAA